MRIHSTFIIVFFCSALSAMGAPGPGSGSRGIKKPGRAPQPFPRPLLPAPKYKTGHYAKKDVEKLLKPFTLFICVHRMLYKDFAGIDWVGAWAPSESLKTKFALYVTKCVLLVLPFVEEMANSILSQPPETWNEAQFVRDVCQHRCDDPFFAVDFGGVPFNDHWPSDVLVILRCKRECKIIYESLLNEVPRGGVLAESGEKDEENEENKEVTKAIGVVKKTMMNLKLGLGDTKKAASKKGGKDRTSLRVQLLKTLHENAMGKKEGKPS